MRVLTHSTATFKNDNLVAAEYPLVVEEPLEIFIDDTPYAVTMRTPGDDLDLVAGFCFSEGLVNAWSDFIALEHCPAAGRKRRVSVRLRPGMRAETEPAAVKKVFVSKSSCGLCGKEQVADICVEMRRVELHDSIYAGDILTLRTIFEAGQELYRITRATHSAAVFNLSQDLLAFAEDVGRHNAFDKAIGKLLREDRMEQAYLAIVSSRLSFEMLQKAGRAGLQVLAGLSAPTGMAVAMAEELNITLIGLLREHSLTLFTHPERIIGQQPTAHSLLCSPGGNTA